MIYAALIVTPLSTQYFIILTVGEKITKDIILLQSYEDIILLQCYESYERPPYVASTDKVINYYLITIDMYVWICGQNPINDMFDLRIKK